MTYYTPASNTENSKHARQSPRGPKLQVRNRPQTTVTLRTVSKLCLGFLKKMRVWRYFHAHSLIIVEGLTERQAAKASWSPFPMSHPNRFLRSHERTTAKESTILLHNSHSVVAFVLPCNNYCKCTSCSLRLKNIWYQVYIYIYIYTRYRVSYGANSRGVKPLCVESQALRWQALPII